MRVADIEIPRGGDDGAVVFIRIGALHIRLDLDNHQRNALCAALLSGTGEAAAGVDVRPLQVPKEVTEISEITLNAREVLIGR